MFFCAVGCIVKYIFENYCNISSPVCVLEGFQHWLFLCDSLKISCVSFSPVFFFIRIEYIQRRKSNSNVVIGGQKKTQLGGKEQVLHCGFFTAFWRTCSLNSKDLELVPIWYQQLPDEGKAELAMPELYPSCPQERWWEPVDGVWNQCVGTPVSVLSGKYIRMFRLKCSPMQVWFIIMGDFCGH